MKKSLLSICQEKLQSQLTGPEYNIQKLKELCREFNEVNIGDEFDRMVVGRYRELALTSPDKLLSQELFDLGQAINILGIYLPDELDQEASERWSRFMADRASEAGPATRELPEIFATRNHNPLLNDQNIPAKP